MKNLNQMTKGQRGRVTWLMGFWDDASSPFSIGTDDVVNIVDNQKGAVIVRCNERTYAVDSDSAALLKIETSA